MTSGDHSAQRVHAVLFDFFGTLVGYQPDRGALGYPTTHRLIESWGLDMRHDDFIAAWDRASSALESESRRTLREFDMTDAAAAFARTTGLALTPDEHERLGATFVGEWSEHLTPVSGAADMLHRMAGVCRLGVVSNTHDRAMVPDMLTRMGLAPVIEVTVLSVDHGYCKPHPSIYHAALDRLGAEPDEVLFVGDSHAADFVGPEEVGMRGHLIDPDHRHRVPPARRLQTVLDIEALAMGAAGE